MESLEKLWNFYALEEDDQRKKLWLDIFLCRANKDSFQDSPDFLGFARKHVVSCLIGELKTEIGLFCGNNLAPEDLEQLKRSD